MNYAPSFIMKVLHLKDFLGYFFKKNYTFTQQKGFSLKSIINKDANT